MNGGRGQCLIVQRGQVKVDDVAPIKEWHTSKEDPRGYAEQIGGFIGAWLAIPLAGAVLYGGYQRSRESTPKPDASPANWPEPSAF